MQFFVPPFLNQLPFDEATITGVADRLWMMAGAAMRADARSTADSAPSADAEARN
jgi:hypothetical protein